MLRVKYKGVTYVHAPDQHAIRIMEAMHGENSRVCALCPGCIQGSGVTCHEFQDRAGLDSCMRPNRTFIPVADYMAWRLTQ